MVSHIICLLGFVQRGLSMRLCLLAQLAEGEAPPTIGTPYKWNKKHNLLDYDNNGYT